jgi:hypothetical protein
MAETDSSNIAIGAILSQKSPNDNKIHPIAFYSSLLSPLKEIIPSKTKNF